MAKITAAMVKELRETTGAGMMDCKKALTATDGDKEKAIDWLREKGISKAEKKAGRIAAEGAVAAYISDDAKVGVLVEVNCETDFAAGNEQFRALEEKIAKHIAATNPADLDALNASEIDGKTVAALVTEATATIGEKISLRRFVRYESEGRVASYIHMGGKIGVLVNLEVSGGIDATVIGKDIAMQIAALNPRFWDKSQVSEDVLAEEKKILVAQMDNDEKMASKPLQVKEKIAAGKMNKFFEENCLVDQAFVKENKTSVSKYVDAKAKELGGTISIKNFARFEKGEGLAKREDDFAAEVAAMAKK